MKTFVAGQEVATAAEFAELALGTPLELWLGPEDESEQERVARLDAARDILADDPGLVERVTRVAVEAIAPHLSTLTVLPQAGRARPVRRRTGTAA